MRDTGKMKLPKIITIFALFILLVTTVMAATISNCQTISTPGTYELINDISATATCLTVSNDDILIDCKGYTITYANTSSGNGIYTLGNDNVTIQNCNIRQYKTPGSYTIYLSGNNNYVLRNNITNLDSTSIYFASSGNIINNIINNSYAFYDQYGINLYASSGGNIFNNTIYSKTKGIHIFVHSGETLKYNKINSDYFPITFETNGEAHCNHNIDTTNTYYDTPIYFNKTDYYKLEDTDNIGAIILCGSSHAFIDNVSLDKAGIFIAQSENVTIKNSDIKSNSSAIFLDKFTNNFTIENNELNSGTTAAECGGIYSRNQFDYGKILNNNITCLSTNNCYGIYFATYSNDNNVTGNIIKDFRYGFSITTNGYNNLLYNNYFRVRNAYATFTGTSYYNDLNITNTTATNVMGDNNIGGNYWGFYNSTGFSDTCTDADLDNFCDSPLVLNTNNTDYLPLAHESPPTHDTPALSASSINNLTSDNLTVYNQSTSDKNGDPVKNIINWKKNSQSRYIINTPFEAGSTSSYSKDYSGYGNNIQPDTSMCTYLSNGGIDGKGAYYFPGTCGLKVPVSTSTASYTDRMTVAAWINISDYTLHRPVANIYQASNYPIRFYVIQTSGKLTLQGYNSSFDAYSSITSTSTVTPNQWHHVAFTVGDGLGTVYIDGQNESSGLIVGDLHAQTSVPLRIGYDTGGAPLYMKGYIDEFIFTNITLSSEQIAALYNNRTDLIVSQETSKSDSWQACITPNDGTQDGQTKCSNTLTIQGPPTHTTPLLQSSSNTNKSDENITVYPQNLVDPNGHDVKKIISWKKDTNPIEILNIPFEGGSNTTYTKDYSGYNIPVTVNYTSWQSNGGYDAKGAYLFNGINDYIALPDNIYDTHTEGVISMWVNPKEYSGYPFALANSVSGSNIFHFQIRNDSANCASGSVYCLHVGRYVGGLGTRTTYGSITIPLNTWTHIAFSVNSTGSNTYINGVKDTNVYHKLFSLTDNSWFDNFATTTNTYTIGAGRGAFFQGAFNGSIDDVRIYNVSLSDQQITLLAQNRTDMIASQDTTVGDVWQACVTPNDGFEDGTELCSNTLNVLASTEGPSGTYLTNSTISQRFSFLNVSSTLYGLDFNYNIAALEVDASEFTCTPSAFIPDVENHYSTVDNGDGTWTTIFQPNGTYGKDAVIAIGDDHFSQNLNYGNDERLRTRMVSTSTYVERSYIEFEIDILDTENIINAKLDLYKGLNSGTPPTYSTGIYRVTESWDESIIKGTNYPSNDSISYDSISVISTLKWYNWTITNLVQEWVNETYPNYGLLLQKDQTGGFGWHQYNSSDAGGSRPILSITYVPNCDKGIFTSQVFDTNGTQDFKNITWTEFEGELPNNQQTESRSVSENIDMSNNIFLLHLNNNPAFNENTSYLKDFSGSGYNCNQSTGSNKAEYTDNSKFTRALKLDENDVYECGDIDEIDGATELTSTYWINWSGDGYSVIGAKWSTNTAYWLDINSGNVRVGWDPVTLEQANVELLPNVWAHVAIVYNGSKTVTADRFKFYINGTEVPSSGSTPPTQLSDDGTEPFRFGYSGGNQGPNSTLDEFALWDTALTATDVSNLYKRGSINLDLKARTCDDASCSGEAWVDIDDQGYQAKSLSLDDNQYFQYKFYFENSTSQIFPELYNVTVTYEAVSTGCEPPGSGDWNITDISCIVQDQTYDVDGDIIVNAGTTLVLNGTTRLNFSSTNQYIYVNQGGEIQISDTASLN
ncbi:LamG-like jellyroll fold domain-containing protein [Nanoarchaeota archaeon]